MILFYFQAQSKDAIINEIINEYGGNNNDSCDCLGTCKGGQS
jgi:hypothetical protein